ncbi:MAG TPA: hypothetical protein VF476_01700, partial [Chitinophagaceae bacterium]
MDFQFQHKEFVLLFGAIVIFIILFIFLWQWKRKVKKRMGDSKLVSALTAGFSSRLFLTKFILLSVGFA